MAEISRRVATLDQTEVRGECTIYPTEIHPTGCIYALLFDVTNGRWVRPPPKEAIPMLLQALDDPKRTVQAHYLLCVLRSGNWVGGTRWNSPFRWKADFWDRTDWLDASGSIDNLRIAFHIDSIPEKTAIPEDFVVYGSRVDPAQFPAIREQWHRRLDQHIVTMAYWKLIAVLLLLPGLRLCIGGGRLARARSRRARRLCPACGYDLRASPDGCPECGTAAE